MDDVLLQRRLAAIEQQLAAICQHVGLPYEHPGSGLPTEVLALVGAGKTTEAIAKLRRLQGLTLIEAKAAVEGAGQ